MNPHTILFVDDERNVLAALRRLFRKEGWNLLFADSGEKGLRVLAARPVDLVVSDVLMPAMDGVDFLKQVRDRYPDTLRFILTGYTEKEFVKRAVAEECAHRVLSKPWDDEKLKATIRQALAYSGGLKQEGQGLQAVLNSLPSLPTLPQVYLEMREVLADASRLSADRIAEVIQRDLSISARLLRWANSAVFGQRTEVDTVKRAMVVLGLEMVEGLVLSMSVFDTLSSEGQEAPGFSREAFWAHSVGCGVIAKMLMEAVSADKDTVGGALMAGLLHDMGKLVEDRYLHDRFEAAVRQARRDGGLLVDAEAETLGTTHVEIGTHLAELWNLPSSLTRAICWHHAPDECKGDRQIVTAVHVADVLAYRFGVGESGNFRAPVVDRNSWARFNLSREQLSAIKAMAEEGGI